MGVRNRAVMVTSCEGNPDPDVPFAVFYQQEYRRAVRLAWLLVRSDVVAEDLAQEAFISLSGS